MADPNLEDEKNLEDDPMNVLRFFFSSNQNESSDQIVSSVSEQGFESAGKSGFGRLNAWT